MMRKFAAMILGLLLGASATLGLAACGEKTDPNTLVVWVQSVNQPEYFSWVKQRFEAENPGFKLKVEPKVQSALGDSLDVTLGGRKAPDFVATWGGLVVSKLVAGNKVVDLTDTIAAAAGDHLVKSAAYNALDGNGKYYSLPLNGFASPVIYYNKTYFDSKNISAPTTYEELKSIAKTIRTDNKQPLVAGFSTWHLPHFMQAIHARTMSPENFERLIGKNKESNPFSLPGFKEGWDLFKLYNTDQIFVNNITGYDANSANMEFINQKAVMFTAPSLDLYTLNDSATFELGTFVLPPAPESVLPDGLTAADMASAPLVSGVYSDVFVVNAKSSPEKIELSKKLVTLLLTQEAQAKLLEFDLFPVRDDISLENANPVLAPVVEKMDLGVSGFYQNFSATGLDLELLSAGGKLLTGTYTAQQAAEQIVNFYKKNVMD